MSTIFRRLGAFLCAFLIIALTTVFPAAAADLVIHTVAGVAPAEGSTGYSVTNGGFSGDFGPATSANLTQPTHLRVDANDNLYILDGNDGYQRSRVRRVDAATGIITTVAGNGYTYNSAVDGGLATDSGITLSDIALDGQGNLYLNDLVPLSATGGFYATRVRRVDAKTGIITTVAGIAGPQTNTSGVDNGGPATSAYLQPAANIGRATSLAANSAGVFYFVSEVYIGPYYTSPNTPPNPDYGQLQMVSGGLISGFPQGVYQVPQTPPYSDSVATSLVFLSPAGGLYGYYHQMVGTMSPNSFTPIAGVDCFYITPAFNPFSPDGSPALTTALTRPHTSTMDPTFDADALLDIAVAPNGDVYYTAGNVALVRKVSAAAGTVSTVAGSAKDYGQNTPGAGFAGDGGPPTSAWLTQPNGLCLDSHGSLYIVDSGNNVVRMVSLPIPEAIVINQMVATSGVAEIIDPHSASGTVGAVFGITLIANNNPTGYTAVGLPPGLALDAASGVLSGTPTASGTFHVYATAQSANGPGRDSLTLIIYGAPGTPIITSENSATGTLGDSFVFQLVATPAPTVYGATGLPPGLSVDAGSGLISGVPTTRADTFLVTVTAGNATGTAVSALNINILAPVSPRPAITSPLTATGTCLSPFTYTVTTSGDTTGGGIYVSSLPDGLTFDLISTISGTPTVAGIFNVSLIASYYPAAAETTSAMLTLTIVPATEVAPVINECTATVGDQPATTVATDDVVTFYADASDAIQNPLTYTWDFGDGSTDDGNLALHNYANAGTYTATLTVSDGTLSVQASPPPINVLAPPSGGDGMFSISEFGQSDKNPLNGMAIRVLDSNGGILDLQVLLNAANASAFTVSTAFGVANDSLPGTRFLKQFFAHGLYVATSVATLPATGAAQGKARKTLAIGAREAQDAPALEGILPPSTNQIGWSAIKGKFAFGPKAHAKDTVAFTGTIILPDGFNHAVDQEFWIGIGNIVDRVTVSSKGRAKSKSALGRISALSIKYPAKTAVKKAKGSKPAPPANQATVNVALSMAGMSAAGFDTEGILPQLLPGEEKKKSLTRNIQVLMELAGVPYEMNPPLAVDFTLSKKKDSGTISALKAVKGAPAPVLLTRDQAIAKVTTAVLAALAGTSFAAYAPQDMLAPGDVVGPAMPDSTLTLNVASASWFFFIDLAPSFMFAHPVQYVLVDAATGTLTSENAQWWPLLNTQALYGDSVERARTPDRFAPPYQPLLPAALPAGAAAASAPRRATRGIPAGKRGPLGKKVAVLYDAGNEEMFRANVDRMELFLAGSADFNMVTVLKAPETTTAKLISTIQTVAGNLASDDLFLLYITCHGLEPTTPTRNFKFDQKGAEGGTFAEDMANLGTYLIHDSRKGQPGTDNVKPCNIDIILDTCFSGGAINPLVTLFSNRPEYMVNVFTAADANNSSAGFDSFHSPGGVYTFALVDDMITKLAGHQGPGFLTALEFNQALLESSAVAKKTADTYKPIIVVPNAQVALLNRAVHWQAGGVVASYLETGPHGEEQDLPLQYISFGKVALQTGNTYAQDGSISGQISGLFLHARTSDGIKVFVPNTTTVLGPVKDQNPQDPLNTTSNQAGYGYLTPFYWNETLNSGVIEMVLPPGGVQK
ncbi:MAG: putative Ig domain-containing protein [Planctomycetota bacterium]